VLPRTRGDFAILGLQTSLKTYARQDAEAVSQKRA
jgi:hypothetical protein